MRRPLTVAGVVVILVGLGVIAYTQITVQPVPIPADPSGEIISGFHVVAAAHVTVRWWGGIATTVVHLFACSDTTCVAGAAELGNGTGAAGSFMVAIDSTHSYVLNSTGGPPVNGSLTVSGLTNLGIIGVILVATGVVLAAWAMRGRRGTPAERDDPTGEPGADEA